MATDEKPGEVAPNGVIRATAGTADARGEGPEAATARAVEGALARADLRRPVGAWIALSGAWTAWAGDALEAALNGAERALPGCSGVAVASWGAGLLAADGEWRQRDAVGVLLVEGADLRAFSVEELPRREDSAGPEVAARLDHDLRPQDAVVVWADALAGSADALVASLASALGPASLVGVGLSAPHAAGAPVVALRGRFARHGLVGWRWRATSPPHVAIAGATRALTQPLEVTRARGHWISSLGGRSALDVFRAAAGAPLFRDPSRATRLVKVAVLESPDGSEPRVGTPRRLANVVGFDPGRGAISVAPAIASGQQVELVQLDPETGRRELRSAVAGADTTSPACALCFSCRGLGIAPFDLEGVESGVIESGLGGRVPWLGIAGDYQFATSAAPGNPSSGLGPSPSLLTFASILCTLPP